MADETVKTGTGNENAAESTALASEGSSGATLGALPESNETQAMLESAALYGVARIIGDNAQAKAEVAAYIAGRRAYVERQIKGGMAGDTLARVIDIEKRNVAGFVAAWNYTLSQSAASELSGFLVGLLSVLITVVEAPARGADGKVIV